MLMSLSPAHSSWFQWIIYPLDHLMEHNLLMSFPAAHKTFISVHPEVFHSFCYILTRHLSHFFFLKIGCYLFQASKGHASCEFSHSLGLCQGVKSHSCPKKVSSHQWMLVYLILVSFIYILKIPTLGVPLGFCSLCIFFPQMNSTCTETEMKFSNISVKEKFPQITIWSILSIKNRFFFLYFFIFKNF